MTWKAEKPDEKKLAIEGLSAALINFFSVGGTLEECEKHAIGSWQSQQWWTRRDRMFRALNDIQT